MRRLSYGKQNISALYLGVVDTLRVRRVFEYLSIRNQLQLCSINHSVFNMRVEFKF